MKTVADPGFPQGRQHTILQNFHEKLHEMKRIWVLGGGGASVNEKEFSVKH